jgi:cobalamin biosynthesis Co2+ chelatase CbiK
MNQYIITEEQLKTIQERRGSHYISCQGKFRDEVVAEVRSHPYIDDLIETIRMNRKDEREKVLDELEKLMKSKEDKWAYDKWTMEKILEELRRAGEP